jgi:hypothetical protein
MQEIAVLAVGLAGVFLPLGRDRQGVVFQGDVHIILLKAGQLGLDVNVVAVLSDVHCVGRQAAAGVLLLAVKQPDEQVIEVPLGGLEPIDARTATVPVAAELLRGSPGFTAWSPDRGRGGLRPLHFPDL